jgi:hypothetical protein
MTKNSEFRSLLQSVVLHWQQSAKAYTEYMQHGKKFRYAKILKEHNTSAKKLLEENITVIPDGFKKNAVEIIEHYTIWSARWDDLKSKLDPAPDDEFVFENDHCFPKIAAQRLEAAFLGLSQKSN